MKMNHSLLGLLSIIGGIILMATTKLLAVECRMGEPGGVNEGGTGLPFPYYSCGVWGESFSWTLVIVDFIILSFFTYLILKLAMKLRTKNKSANVT